MATKLDIIKTGRMDFTLGLNGGNPYKEGSWQNAAWQTGFETAADEAIIDAQAEGHPVTPQIADEVKVTELIQPALTKNAKHHSIIVAPVVKKGIPHVVLTHIDRLLNEADDWRTDPTRAKRLYAKIDKLRIKWGTHA